MRSPRPLPARPDDHDDGPPPESRYQHLDDQAVRASAAALQRRIGLDRAAPLDRRDRQEAGEREEGQPARIAVNVTYDGEWTFALLDAETARQVADHLLHCADRIDSTPYLDGDA